jgi:hypothetical protein
MKDEPKNIWKKPWEFPAKLIAWFLIFTCAAVMVAFAILYLTTAPVRNAEFAKITMLVSIVLGLAVIGLIAIFIRCLGCWQNRRRFLFGVACFITLIALFYAEEDWRGKHDWEKFKRECEAKGEKFDPASVVPPSVPDDQNFAMTPIWIESMQARFGSERARLWYGDKFPDNGRTNFTDRLALDVWRNNDSGDLHTNGDWAKGTFTDLKLWQAYYRAPVETNQGSAIATNEFPVAAQPQSPAEDVLLALSKYDPAIEELNQASRLPYSRFPIQYDAEDPFSIMLPHLAALKRGSQVLELRAVAHLQNGQAENAFGDVELALRLADSVRTEPIMISHLVRIAMLQITFQPVWEGLAEHRWSDEQLVTLDAELAKLDFLADYELSQRGELAFFPKALEYRRHTRNPESIFYFSEYDNNPKHPPGVELAVFVFRHCPGGWFYQNQICYYRFALQSYLPMLDDSRQLASPASAKRANDAQLKEAAHLNPYNFIEYQLLFPPPPFDYLVRSKLAERFACAQSSVDLARVAIALERYRLAHGEFPESLDALAPQFIAKIPHDIINGQPLHYRRMSDPSSRSSDAASGQFVLYSVGWNETDDGGAVGLTKSGAVDRDTGDWVWRYPAR